MVIRRRLDTREACRRSKEELGMVEPAGRPSEEDLSRQNKEFTSYKLQREPQIMREHMRKVRYKGGAIQ